MDGDALIVEGLAEEAADTAHSVVHAAAEDGLPDRVAYTSCYTTGFEAGLALGLHSPAIGWRYLTAIDRVVLEGDEQAIVRERDEYLARFRDVYRRSQT